MKHYRLIDQNPNKTKRLVLTPMNGAALAERAESAGDETARNAYLEMRRCVAAYPDQALWYTGWRMTLRKTADTVGYLGFRGTPLDRTVELGYDIPEENRSGGYAAEATKALCDWAFLKENVYFVHVATGEGNESSGQILEKMKFYRVESPAAGQTCWELERPASVWTAVYLCLGLCIGLTLGSTLFGSQALGMVIGMLAGLALGISLDSQDRAARKRDKEPKKIEP